VVIKGRNEAKRSMAEECGLEYLTDAGGSQFDRVIEAVGSEKALDESITLTAPGGRLVLMGNPDGPRTLSQDTYWRILRKQLTLTGTWNSSYSSGDSDWAESLQAVADRRLKAEAVVTQVFGQSELPRRLEIMREKTQFYCKILTEWNKS